MIDRQLALDMRRNGATLREIGDYFGVSYQRVSQVLYGYTRTRRDEAFIEKIVYKGIYDYMVAHENMTMPKLALEMYGCVGKNRAYVERLRRLFEGKDANISKGVIDRLLALTGLTYERFFELRDGFAEVTGDV